MKSEGSLSSNKKLVYRLIAEQGPVSKADLLSSSAITSSTLTRLLDDMAEERLIEGTALGTSSGGRRPILYQINPDFKYIFGLEISRFSSTLGLFDMALNPKSTVRWRMDETFTPERLVEHAVRQMRLFLKDHAITEEQILGVGIAAVGPLDRHSGIVLEPLYFPAKGWRNVAICQLIERETGWTCHLENGANAALMGEIWAMRNKGIQHALYIHAGVSLRSSIMSHGRIVHGSVDTEGSIGQMIIQPDGPRLNASGNYGALEAYASIQALEKTAQSQAKAGRPLGSPLDQLPPEDLKFDWLLRALETGNPFAAELFEQSAVYFGIGLANLINTFHPEMVILGGALINANAGYFDTAAEIANRNTFYYPKYTPRFSKGLLREDAVVTGAALTVWQSMAEGHL
ncbi:ROK family transcriptional regulator [Paenibacillus nanensis]|uniref:ROK family transcriptional regulator n=1 Tax=Paenibacillus nanensis TaxID=393251 RepID=A0A3A1USL7_9BACL|nr:ROK family transcriptional regulator [Paenibacillus nanensis]RIX50172.1 ROK family transcriptional regulator [Paenibacillus nanensis]